MSRNTTSPNTSGSTAFLAALLAVACAASPEAVLADRVVVAGREYAGAKIVGLQRGRLRFRLAGGSLEEAWLDEVHSIHVDHGGAFLDFNQAEQLAAEGKHAAAVPRYIRSLRLVEDYWQDLISIRLVTSSDSAGDFDDAVEHFIRVLLGPHAGPQAAARLIPSGIPTKRNAKVTRAMARLNAKLRPGTGVTGAQKALLSLLRYEILRHTGDKEATPAARQVVQTSIPASARSTQVYDIVRRACSELLQTNVDAQTLQGLDTAIRDCPKASLPSFLLLKGRALLRTATDRADIIRAVWPLLRVVIHFSEDPLAPEALYESALALERIGRKGQAVDLLRECRDHRQVSASTNGLATIALKRLQSSGTD